LIQQSVNCFFNEYSVQFFACSPHRFGDRTIYRFPASANTKPSSAAKQQTTPTGYIALTLDDAPCRMNNPKCSKLPQVLELLRKYNQSKATFMVIEQFIQNNNTTTSLSTTSTPAQQQQHEQDMVQLLLEGHELANHGTKDAPMHAYKLDTFVKAVEQCNQRIIELQDKAVAVTAVAAAKKNGNINVNIDISRGVRWFRAPHGKYTKVMEQGLEQCDMYNVMCDVYAVVSRILYYMLGLLLLLLHACVTFLPCNSMCLLPLYAMVGSNCGRW
jgi:peptidoglycan/xylan/chitin deacetylase (PgdA/CDA1 family)